MIVELLLLTDEALIEEYASEYWAADRCVNARESKESAARIAELKAELLRRMDAC